MTAQTREAVRTLKASIKDNAPRVEKKITKSGAKPDRAVVYSTAKYYKTLKKLAKE